MFRTHLCRSRSSSSDHELDGQVHRDDLDPEPNTHSMVRLEGERSLGSMEFQEHSREERAEPNHVQVLANQPQVCST